MTKKKEFVLRKLLFVSLAVLFVSFAGCPIEPAESPVTKEPPVIQLLRQYIGPNPQNWGDEDDREEEITYVYYLDTLRFEDFRAELEAGGEYSQYESRTYKHRDWDLGRTWAEGCVRPDGSFELHLGRKDNSGAEYRYEKVPGASGSELYKLLRKHMGPEEQHWGDEDDREEEATYVYFLAPDHFKDFEGGVLEALGGEYFQADSWEEEDREWEQGKSFARWAERPDGSYELDLCRANNSRSGYWYKEIPQAGDSWDEQWDEGKVKFTYLGLNRPDDFDHDSEGNDSRQYKGYYKISYYEAQDEGHKTYYVYYPDTGDEVEYSDWID
jgi:hypothetical protein